MQRRFLLLCALCAACGPGRSRELAPPTYEDDPAARAALVATAMEGYRAAFVLTWNGRRIGEAHETFVAADDALGGFRFQRSERVVVRRGDATSVAHTSIVIDVDAAMIARRVVVERDGGGPKQHARASRLFDDGWSVQVGDAPARLADGAAVPSTLVPLYVAAGGSQGRVFDGPVLVEGANLAGARLTVDVEAQTARSRYVTAAGELRAVARLDAQGRLVEAGLGAELGSRRTDEAELAAPFDPPEIVDSSAIQVAGSPASDPGGPAALRITVSGVRVPPPALPEIPEQTVAMAPGGTWDVVVEPTAFPQAGSGPWRELRERTDWVARTLADDLRVATLSPSEALATGRGDCTAHAVVLEEDLRERGYQTRLVTGFVVEDGALRRHRWVAVRIGKRWIPVDPMFDEVPARPTHIALAVHGASPDELAFIDDVVFAGWSGAIAAWAK